MNLLLMSVLEDPVLPIEFVIQNLLSWDIFANVLRAKQVHFVTGIKVHCVKDLTAMMVLEFYY